MVFKAGCINYFLSLFILFLLPVSTQAKDSITWLEAVAPPFFIHEGEFKGQGYEDLITDILIEKMYNYEHIHMKANISRHYQQWRQGEQACSLAMFKTQEREEFAYFSIPSLFTLPPVLIIKKDNFAAFGAQKTVLLEALLKDNKVIIGRSTNRSYGAEFDNVLNTYGNKTNVYTYEDPEASINLFKMLLADRIDALPGLPEEAMYLAETMGIGDQIMTINIEENQQNHDSYLTSVACSKTEWGKKTIENINEVLLSERPKEQYRAAYERWLDKSSIDGYRKLYKEVFLKTEE